MYRVLIAALSLSLFVVGCGATTNARHIAVVGNVAVFESLSAIQQTADTLLQTKQISLEQRQALGKVLLPALETGQKLAKLTDTWPADQPAPAELKVLVGQLRQLVDQVMSAWPDSPAKATLGQKISIAQNAVLALLAVFIQ